MSEMARTIEKFGEYAEYTISTVCIMHSQNITKAKSKSIEWSKCLYIDVMCILVYKIEASMIFSDTLLIIRINAFDFSISPESSLSPPVLLLPVHPIAFDFWPYHFTISSSNASNFRSIFCKNRLHAYKRFGNKIQYQATHTHTHTHTVLLL